MGKQEIFRPTQWGKNLALPSIYNKGHVLQVVLSFWEIFVNIATAITHASPLHLSWFNTNDYHNTKARWTPWASLLNDANFDADGILCYSDLSKAHQASIICLEVKCLVSSLLACCFSLDVLCNITRCFHMFDLIGDSNKLCCYNYIF